MSYFENKEVNGIYYSRFIASYAKSGGNVFYRDEFRAWLEHLGYLNGEDISLILEMATCGKLELETDAKMFLKTKKKETFY